MTDYTIIIEKGDGNCSAYCPDLPCVAAAAETEEETAELMRDAIEFHLEGLKEDDLPIPQPNGNRQKHKSDGLIFCGEI